MAGKSMLSFVDLSTSATERCPGLLDWVREWTDRPSLQPLSPEGWFEEGHGIAGGAPDRHGVYIPHHCESNKLFLWSPPPAAADAAFEELLKSRQKRTDLFHVILVPRIMSPRWRRLFNKVVDFSFVVSPGPLFWPAPMFEKLWVGILLPHIPHRPWSLRRAPLLVGLGKDLRRVLETSPSAAGSRLRKLLALPARVASLPECVSCRVLHMPRSRHVPTEGHQGRGRESVAQRGGTGKDDVNGN